MKFMDYVKATTIEEKALEYQNKGYEVVMSPIDVSFPFETRPQDYDIVATKGDYKVAIEVIARAKLGREVMRIAKLRRQAKKEGFDDFRLVVVDPPRQIPVNVEGIEPKLRQYMIENLPQELAELPNHPDVLPDGVQVLKVTSITIDSIAIQVGGMRVAGRGTVIVNIYYKQDDERFWEDDDFPFNFDVELDRQLNLTRVHDITVNSKHF